MQIKVQYVASLSVKRGWIKFQPRRARMCWIVLSVLIISALGCLGIGIYSLIKFGAEFPSFVPFLMMLVDIPFIVLYILELRALRKMKKSGFLPSVIMDYVNEFQ